MRGVNKLMPPDTLLTCQGRRVAPLETSVVADVVVAYVAAAVAVCLQNVVDAQSQPKSV